jgi:murein DD-endopeptidase MepM/ murein hydrolase activator NlpD
MSDRMEFHGAVDLACSTGDPIRASRAGAVLLGGRVKVLGNAVVVHHAGGWVTVYAHMDTLAVYGGLTVEQGQIIGTCGQTGRATGPHIHFEIRDPSGRAVDPLPHLRARGRR